MHLPIHIITWCIGLEPGLTKYYQNSDFYSYACKNPGSTATTADVAVAMVASSYESDIESGSYVRLLPSR